MKTVSISFVPNPAVTDPADIVAQYKFTAGINGQEVASGSGAPTDVKTFEVDPGAAGVDISIDYSFADAAGNWTPTANKTLRVEPDVVPDTTPPPANAGDIQAVVVAPAAAVEAAPATEAAAPAAEPAAPAADSQPAATT